MRTLFNTHHFTSRKQHGFTIVELLIVIVVIGILATISLVAFNGVQAKAADVVLKSDLKNASTQLEIAKVESGSYPDDDGSDLPRSEGTTLEYTAASGDYCLTASSSRASTAFHLDSTTGTITEGPCTGHEGTGGDGDVAFDQPNDCPTGFIPVPGNSLFNTQGGFCAMKYEAKNVGDVATSQAAGTPWVNISQTDAMTTSSAACDGCHLISEAEWLTIAHNVLDVDSNWSGGSVGSDYIYSGHNDNSPTGALAADTNDANGYYGTGNVSPSNQRRTLTLTNGEVIWDMAGNVRDWTSGQTSGGQPGASGFAYRQWNAIAGTGSLSPNPYPSYGTPAASNWTSDQGIGQIYSSSTEETGLRGFLRGGGWGSGSGAGVLSLGLGNSPSSTPSDVGFRVAR